MDPGANGQSYAANWTEHQRLQAQAEACLQAARQAQEAYVSAQASLQAERQALAPEQLAERQADCDRLADRAEHAQTKLVEARTAVPAFELKTGPQHAQALEAGLAPAPTLREQAVAASPLAELVQNASTLINATAEASVNSLQGLAMLAQATTGNLALPQQQAQWTVAPPSIEREAPAVPDLGQRMADAYRPVSREQTEAARDTAQRAGQDYADALARAPARDAPPVPPAPDPQVAAPPDPQHEAQQKLAREHADQMTTLQARHKRLDTDPAIAAGFRERLAEQQEAERQQLAERQARELAARSQPLPMPGHER